MAQRAPGPDFGPYLPIATVATTHAETADSASLALDASVDGPRPRSNRGHSPTWHEFTDMRPDLSAAGRALLYQFGVGLALLATTRADGGPRVHPICPQIHDDGLFAFIVPSPKRGDLRRDGRFALHSFPCADNEDAIYLTGTARSVDDVGTRQALVRQFLEERAVQQIAAPDQHQRLFAFDIVSCLLTRTAGHGDPHPVHTVWRQP